MSNPFVFTVDSTGGVDSGVQVYCPGDISIAVLGTEKTRKHVIFDLEVGDGFLWASIAFEIAEKMNIDPYSMLVENIMGVILLFMKGYATGIAKGIELSITD